MDSATTCLNCGALVQGSFCAHCGQSAHVPKFTWRYVLQELPAGLFAWDKGFLYTAKALFLRPGPAIAEYIAGKRVLHFRPLPMLAFCAGILGLLGLYTPVPEALLGTEDKKKFVQQVTDWLNSHYVWIELALLPVMSFSTWVWFRKRGYNLVEHVVINAFLASQRLILNILLFPVVFLSNSLPVLAVQSTVVSLASFGLFTWSFVGLFARGDRARVAMRTMSAYAMAYVLLGLLGVAFGSYFVLTGRLHFR
ncbi:MAG: DUF3667 domain-containing protein [Flavobacteriales bacterium]